MAPFAYTSRGLQGAEGLQKPSCQRPTHLPYSGWLRRKYRLHARHDTLLAVIALESLVKLLAMLALGDVNLARKLEEFRDRQTKAVVAAKLPD